jgi:hypothetical protein
MSTTLLKLIADLELSLAAAVSVGATTATLSTAVDGDGTSIPAGKYGFTIDGDNSAKEFIVCDLSGTALTNIQSISLQGATSTGFSNYHRIGATVTITDWAILSRVINNLTGITGFDSGTPLLYDAEPSYSDPLTIPTVQYVLDTANGGPVTFNATTIAGDAGENVADGDWVYYNTTDGEWYKTDADDTAKCNNVQIGKARGAGTNGNPITGGVFISGIETVGTYIAGTTYYISNTAGELSTSAGTNSVVVGVGDANGDLVLKTTTPNQVDALVGTGSFGTPSSANKFVTETFLNLSKQVQRQYDVAGSPHTWTKPTGLVKVLVQAWGGGGSGGRADTDEVGGGGGGYQELVILAASLGATETVTIGAGGAVSTGFGNAGGNSTFGSLVTGYGGGGGGVFNSGAGGGGGGGKTAAGASVTNSGSGGSAGDNFGTAGQSTGGSSPAIADAGGGGGAGNNGGSGGTGGYARFGGAGGGGAAVSADGAAGLSLFGGNGGVGDASGTNNAGDGSVPGGGGGGKQRNGSGAGEGGAGGAGRIIVTEYYA